MSGCALFLQLPEAEWRMRQAFPVELVEARPGSLASLADWLAAGGYQPHRRRVGELASTLPDACIRLVEVTAGQTAGRLAALTRRAAGEQVAVAALVPEDDEISLSKALAVGPDDLLTYPFDADELVTRLDALQQLGRARAVLAERRRTLARFAPTLVPAVSPTAPRDAPPPVSIAAEPTAARARSRTAAASRPRVLVIGPASQHKVKVAEALARALINYADNLEKAKGALATSAFDLVVLLATNPVARRELLRWPELSGLGTMATLLVLDRGGVEDPLETRQRLAHLPVSDRLILPQPAELVRARMDFWLTFVELQQRLCTPPPGELFGLCHDSLTGLFNHGFFMEHLRTLDLAPPHRRALLVIELVNLARLNEAAGYAAANRYLAALGPALRRQVRAEDLAAYLGGGRFAVLLDDVAPGAATGIGARLARLLGQVACSGSLAPRLTARSIELTPGLAAKQWLQQALRLRRDPSPSSAAA